MSAYDALRIVHSLVRWLALVALVVASVRFARGAWRKDEWSARDDQLHRVTVGVLDVQLVLGIALYATGALSRAFLADPGQTVHVRVLRFFGLEHPTMMLLAIASLHVGRVMVRRAPRHSRAAIGVLVPLVLILAAIPWPWMSIGRPFLPTWPP